VGHPLIFREKILGVLALFSRESLNQADSDWLRMFANQAAVAVANAHAFEEREWASMGHLDRIPASHPLPASSNVCRWKFQRAYAGAFPEGCTWDRHDVSIERSASLGRSRDATWSENLNFSRQQASTNRCS
jgi:hypothetical protein